jgi:hypothetical protein
MVALRVLGVFLVLLGGVWLIQGLGLIPTGSFMDGQGIWALIGGAMVAAGIVAISRSRRRRLTP